MRSRIGISPLATFVTAIITTGFITFGPWVPEAQAQSAYRPGDVVDIFITGAADVKRCTLVEPSFQSNGTWWRMRCQPFDSIYYEREQNIRGTVAVTPAPAAVPGVAPSSPGEAPAAAPPPTPQQTPAPALTGTRPAPVAGRFPVGARVKVEIAGVRSIDICTVLEDQNPGYFVRCDPRTTSNFQDYVALDKWVSAAPDSGPPPTNAVCPSGVPPRVEQRPGAAFFKRVIWESFTAGTDPLGTPIGVSFEQFSPGSSFRNRPGARGHLAANPAGVTVYPWKVSYTLCRQSSSGKFVSKIDTEYLCALDRFRVWGCWNGLITIKSQAMIPNP